MRLLLIRHAKAAPLGGTIVRDADRPLTAQGRRRFLRMAAALVRVAPRPHAILTSGRKRARQTAELAARAWGKLRPEIVPGLTQGDDRALHQALAGVADEHTLVVVGHEPWLSRLTGRLLGSQSGRGFRFRKGGVALLEVKAADPVHGTLLWFLPPRVLRRL